MFQLEFLLRREKLRKLCLNSVDADGFGLQFDDFILRRFHSSLKLVNIVIVQVVLQFMIDCNRVEFIASLIKMTYLLHHVLVQFSDLSDDNFARGAVGVFEFA